MERGKMIKEIKGGFTERMRLAKEYNEWLEKEGNKARVVLANNPQTMIAFLQMKGWQEVPDGAVVLTKEEYERLKALPEKVHDEMDERMKEEIAIEKRMGEDKLERFENNMKNVLEIEKENVRKETETEILKKLNGFRFVMYDEGYEVASWTCGEDEVKQFAKEIGAEVEE